MSTFLRRQAVRLHSPCLYVYPAIGLALVGFVFPFEKSEYLLSSVLRLNVLLIFQVLMSLSSTDTEKKVRKLAYCRACMSHLMIS